MTRTPTVFHPMSIFTFSHVLVLVSVLQLHWVDMRVCASARGQGGVLKSPPKSKREKALFERFILEAEKPAMLYPPAAGQIKELEKYTDIEHDSNSNAVFSVYVTSELTRETLLAYVVPLREVFNGDIVLGINETTPDILQLLHKHRVIAYKITLNCIENKFCVLSDRKGMTPIPVAQMRYYFYQLWAKKYLSSSYLMITDFRDVYFQSNPFEYQPYEWHGSDLVTFLEPHPNKIINRCKFNGPWIGKCYGKEAVKMVGHNMVSCSGISMGTRNGILVYSHIVAKHTNPATRNKFLKLDKPPTQEKCMSLGTDQGIHNWLLHSGILRSLMKVTVFAQGEGAANNLGSFYGGKKKILSVDLKEVGVFRDTPDGYTVHNWNGKLSPVVHQSDRFNGTTLSDHLYFNYSIAVLRSAIYGSGR